MLFLNYYINTFNLKDFSSRELTRFIKEVVRVRDSGKLSSFCHLYDFDENEIAQLLYLVSKFGNNEINVAIKQNNNISNKIYSWLNKNPDSQLSY